MAIAACYQPASFKRCTYSCHAICKRAQHPVRYKKTRGHTQTACTQIWCEKCLAWIAVELTCGWHMSVGSSMATFSTVIRFSCCASVALALSRAASSCGTCIHTHWSQSCARTSVTQTCSSPDSPARAITSSVAPSSLSAHHHARTMLCCCPAPLTFAAMCSGSSSVTWCSSSPLASAQAIVTSGLPYSALPTVYVQCNTCWSFQTAALLSLALAPLPASSACRAVV